MTNAEADVRAALLSIEANLMWSHVPRSEQPGPDDVVGYTRVPDGHLRVLNYPAGSDVEDTFYLRGLGPGEEPCVYQVRSWLVDVPGGRVDSGRRVVTVWRHEAVVFWAASEDFYPDDQ